MLLILLEKLFQNPYYGLSKRKRGNMKISIKEGKGLKRQLEFVVPFTEVDKHFAKHYLKIQKKAKMPGFRTGKIPLQTLKQNYKNQAYEAVTDDLFKTFYPKILQENKIHPAGPARLLYLDLEEGKDCKFYLELEVHPQIKVENYTNIELEKPSVLIKEEEIKETLKKLQQSFVKFEDFTKAGPVERGDCLILNVDGFSDQKEKKVDYKNLLMEIGKDMLAPGFDDYLIGLHLNEVKEFDFLFPKEHLDLKLAGLSLHIKLQIKAFKKKILPELNDEFAKHFKLDTLKSLKERIRKDLKKNLEAKAQEKMENDLIKQLIKKNPVELPETLIKEQKQKLKDNAIKRLKEYKMPPEEQEVFLKKRDSLFEEEAKDSLHISYLMGKLIQELKITTTKEDIRKSLQESFPTKKPEDMEKKLKQEEYWDNFIFNLTRQKVIAYLMDQAKIT